MKYVVILAYLALLAGVGIVSVKKTKTLDDFCIGGRSIGPWMSAFSYGITYFSAVLFIGYAGQSGWSFGLSSLWIFAGNAFIGCFLAWKLLAQKTRTMTTRLSAITMSDFLSQRYQSPGLKVFSALIIFVFLVPYSSSVYKGLSYFFESVFNVPYEYALIVIAIITAFYLVMGGYFAISTVDFIQGLFMIFGVGVLLYYVVNSSYVGGLSNVRPALNAVDPELTSLFGPNKIGLFALVFLTSFGTWGMPQMTQKFYAVKNDRTVKVATWVTFAIAAWISFGAYFNGSLGHIFFSDLSEAGGTVDMIVPTMLSLAIPEFASIFILLLVLAASVSTLASLVLVSASAIAVDLRSAIRPHADKGKSSMLLMRILCVVFIAVSLYLALKPNVIVNLMSFSWGATAGAFIAPYVLGLYWRGMTKAGAWSAMITGVVFCCAGTVLFPGNVPVVGCLSMIIPVIVAIVVSKLTKPLDKEFLDSLFGKTVLVKSETGNN